MEEQREEELMRVEDAMRAYTGPVLEYDELANAAADRATSSPEPILLARQAPGSWFAIRRDALKAAAPQATVGEVAGDGLLPILFLGHRP